MKRLEPRKQYYRRKKFRFADWQSSSEDGQNDVTGGSEQHQVQDVPPPLDLPPPRHRSQHDGEGGEDVLFEPQQVVYRRRQSENFSMLPLPSMADAEECSGGIDLNPDVEECSGGIDLNPDVEECSGGIDLNDNEETLTASIGDDAGRPSVSDTDTITCTENNDGTGRRQSDSGSDDENEADYEDRVDEDVEKWSTADVTSYMFGIKVRHNVTDSAFTAMWDGFRKVLPALRHHTALPSARTVKRMVLKDLPAMTVDVAFLDTVTKEVTRENGLKEVPRKKFEDKTLYRPIYEVWRTRMVDAVQFHYGLHAIEEKEIILNIDGVPIGRTGRSQIIVSLKFRSCKNIYQLTNAVPFGGATSKKELSVTFLLADILKSIVDLGLTLAYICADAPMRAFLRNQKTHTARLGCDYCYGAATHKKGRPTWCMETLESEKRTLESVRRDYEKVSERTHRFEDFGYKGRSEILDVLPDFDIVQGVPVDPMHLLYLGVGRALFELLFKVGESRPTNQHEPLLSTRRLDEVLIKIRVPYEMPRRPRAMDFKNWKGSEWRNLIVVYFPVVAELLPRGHQRNIWLEFCFLCRAYNLPDEYFSALDKDELKSIALALYKRYQEAFGPLNMRYNVHLLWHLELIRVHGPFSEISAFPFEGSFAASNRSQHAGTSSVGLQSMRHSYFRPLEGHSCKRKIRLHTKTTHRRQDDLLHSEKCCFQLAETPKPNDTFLKVKKINVTTYFAPGASHLDWTSVGVFKYVSTSERVQYIRQDQIIGKLVAVPALVAGIDVLVSVSYAQLRETD